MVFNSENPTGSHFQSCQEWSRVALSEPRGGDRSPLAETLGAETFAMSYRAIWGFWARNQKHECEISLPGPQSSSEKSQK